eukprot:jgi/Mesen1/379/ME000010S_10839
MADYSVYATSGSWRPVLEHLLSVAAIAAAYVAGLSQSTETESSALVVLPASRTGAAWQEAFEGDEEEGGDGHAARVQIGPRGGRGSAPPGKSASQPGQSRGPPAHVERGAHTDTALAFAAGRGAGSDLGSDTTCAEGARNGAGDGAGDGANYGAFYERVWDEIG